MKVLVTGGTGYIGSHAVVELIRQGYEVEIVDNLCNSRADVVEAVSRIAGVRPVFHQVDLLNLAATEEVFRKGQFDLVMHFAGLKAVGESVEKPLLYYKTNLNLILNLLECMEKHNVNKIIFSSSATVYGVQSNPEFNENMQTGIGITNPYGHTKFMVEEILKDLSVSNPKLEIAILRYFNPIGADASGLLGENPNVPSNLMPFIMKVYTGKNQELLIYGNDYDTPDGTCMRDYIHVVDLVRGHIATISKMHSGVSIYNLGTGKATSVLEMVAAFEKASGEKLPYRITGRRAGDLAKFYANPKKAETELNWKAELSIDDAMQDTLNYLNHVRK